MRLSSTRCLVLLGFLLVSPTAATAVPLAAVVVDLGVNCIGIAKDFLGSTENSLSCSESNFWGGPTTGSTFGQAGARALLAGHPAAVNVSATNIVNPAVPALLQTAATATVLYQMQVVFFPTGVNDNQPGGPGTSQPNEIPVNIGASGFVHTTGGNAATGGAGVSIRGNVFVASAGFGGPASDAFSASGPIFLSTFSPTDISVSAFCSTLADNTFEPSATCTAEADPVFFFDDASQAAFDDLRSRQGLPTFTLADFFAFEFSEGISNVLAAPEPGTLAILALGIAGLGAMRRRRNP